jgi:UDP:flavonoid glycosyltransferase YjiC (YdhE family)
MREHGISTTFDRWVQSVEYFVPEPSHYFPSVSKDLHLHYVGNLSWNKFDQKIPDWFHAIKPNGRTIYLSFGGTGFDTKKPIQIAKVLVDAGYRVIVTTGSLSDPADYPMIPGLFVATYLPGDRLSQMVDLVVCHGGYGTMIDAIQNGIPVVTVPFNPDQIMHSLRMQELGVAKCLMSLSIIDIMHVFSFNWKWIEDKGKQISPEHVQKAVKEVLSDIREYKENIQKFNAAYPKRDGAAEVANSIESTMQ